MLWGSRIGAFGRGSTRCPATVCVQIVRGALYPIGSGAIWCFLRISAIHWPAGHVYMPERQHKASQGSYGRPRMTEELNELGLRVGHPLPGR